MTDVKTVLGFYEYVYSFYGDGGLYDLGFKVDYIMIAKATKILIDLPEIDFAGDSFDREKVRDIMITMNTKFSLTIDDVIILES